MTPPPGRVLLGVALIAACTLAMQVLLTRLLAAAVFYHFAFLAISLALLGTGAGGILVYLRRRDFGPDQLRRALSRWSLVFAGLLLVAPGLLVQLDYSFTGKVTLGFAVTLGLVAVLSFLPLLAAGIVLALAVRGYTDWIGRVYAADLAGAALGALVVVPLMWIGDPPLLLAALGVVAAVAAALFADPRPGDALRTAVAPVAVACVLVAGGSAVSAYTLPPVTPAPEGYEPVAERWNPLNRVLGYPQPSEAIAPGPLSEFASVWYDKAYAPVPVWQPGEPLHDWRSLRLGPQSSGYALAGPGRALVIGGGGGRDIHNALTSGQRPVDVIELNRGIRDVVDEDLRRWSGAAYSMAGVNTEIGDGRSKLASRDTKYNQIHIGFTDTLSGNSATAFALTEANLYTVEAYQEYFDHLEPRGILNVSRLYHLINDEALRATVLSLTALRERGVEDPERNVVVLLGRDIYGELFGTVLTRLEPYTTAELRRLRQLAAQRGEGVAFMPGGPYYREWSQLARAPSIEAFCESYRFDVCAPTDDKPFFFNQKRLDDIGSGTPAGYIYSIDPVLILVITLGILLVLSALAFVLPLWLGREAEPPPVSSLLFFAAIGVGFLVLEIVLIQRFVLFLGFPTYALSVVLFSLLVFTGAGALLSSRFRDPRRALTISLAAASAMILLGSFVLEPLLRGLIELAFTLRVISSVLILAPFGLTLGMAMPIGLRRLAALHPAGVPWAWGINGITSVLASVLAVAVAITAGFTAAMLLAAACYLGALAHASFGRWPERVAGPTGELESSASTAA